MTASQPPVFLQGGSHDASDLRRMIEALIGVRPNGFVTQDALGVSQSASPAMSVLVAGGMAFVKGSEATYQGAYFLDNQGSTTLTIDPSDPTNPRRDLIIAHVEDTEYSSPTNDQWSLAVVKGTAAASPSDPSLTAYKNYLVLARVAVGAGVTSITNANITDLRYTTSGQGRVTATGGVHVGASSARPTVTEGALHWDTDTDTLQTYNGSAWRPILARGTATPTTDSSGYATVTHGTGWTPTCVFVMGTSPTGGTAETPTSIVVDNLTSSTFRLRAWGPSGVECDDVAIGISWLALP